MTGILKTIFITFITIQLNTDMWVTREHGNTAAISSGKNAVYILRHLNGMNRKILIGANDIAVDVGPACSRTSE
jgi:hypothetical protein